MSKNSKDAYGAKGKTNVLMFDPEDVVLVEDPKHPLYDERVKLPVSESLVRNIMHHGVLEPIIVAKDPETGKTVVVAGRQRTKATREANLRLRAQGCEPHLLPGVVRRGDDGALAGVMVSENEIREDDSPLGRAKKMQRLLDMGKTEDDLSILFGCTKTTIKNTLSLLECCADVRKAVEKGDINVTAAYDLSKLDVEEQRSTLDKMVMAASTATSKRGKSRAQKEAAGKVQGPSKKAIQHYRAEVAAECSDEAYRAAALAMLDWVLGKRGQPRFPKAVAAKTEAA